MNLIQFGSTPLQVTRIGLGLAALGRPGYINLGHGQDLRNRTDKEAMFEHAQDVLDFAYRKGIRYFDTARSYGKAEEFLAGWKGYKEYDDIVIGSKWGYIYTADWQIDVEKHEVKEHSLKNLERQWPESQKWIGKKLAIYHIHSATPDSGVLDSEEVLDKLWELKKTGIVIGLSLSGTAQSETLEKAMSISRDRQMLFGSVQATWNILEQSATEGLLNAARAGIGIIIKEALANGRLTERNNNPGFLEKQILLSRIAEKYQVSIDALCMAYVLNHPWTHIVLSGASNVEQLESNIKAIEMHITPDDMQILSGLKEPRETYWKDRAALDWN